MTITQCSDNYHFSFCNKKYSEMPWYELPIKYLGARQRWVGGTNIKWGTGKKVSGPNLHFWSGDGATGGYGRTTLLITTLLTKGTRVFRMSPKRNPRTDCVYEMTQCAGNGWNQFRGGGSSNTWNTLRFLGYYTLPYLTYVYRIQTATVNRLATQWLSRRCHVTKVPFVVV